MKFRRIMQLWITGLMFFASAVAYAADQDTLTVSPTGVPGVYELTISGTRDSDTVTVVTVTRNAVDNIYGCGMGNPKSAVGNKIRDAGNQGGESEEVLFVNSGIDIQVPAGAGCLPHLTVTAAIKSGNNPGSSTYQAMFKVFMDPGSLQVITYLVTNPMIENDYKFGNVILPPDQSEKVEGTGLLLSVPPKQSPVSISLQNATAEISGTDSFTLRNLSTEMSTGEKFNTWGTFQWNPSSWSWVLKDGGIQ